MCLYYHIGWDFIGNRNVVAAKTGVVEKVYYSEMIGNTVIIDHGNGWKTRYAHLKSTSVKEGQNITRGFDIGIMGNTGKSSTALHLHFDIEYNGHWIDPDIFY